MKIYNILFLSEQLSELVEKKTNNLREFIKESSKKHGLNKKGDIVND
jgi:hypothetical protein